MTEIKATLNKDSGVSEPSGHNEVLFESHQRLTDSSGRELVLDHAFSHGTHTHKPMSEIKQLLLSALTAPRPAVEMMQLSEQGIFTNLTAVPFGALKNTPQDPEWHPEGDVWIHTCMVIEQTADLLKSNTVELSAAEQEGILWGALLHDNGKAETTTVREKDGRIVSPGHEKAGVEPARVLLDQLGVAEQASKVALAVVEFHMRPTLLLRELEKGVLVDGKFERAVERFKRKLSPVRLEPVLVAAMADRLGRGDTPSKKEQLTFTDAFLKPFQEILTPLIF